MKFTIFVTSKMESTGKLEVDTRTVEEALSFAKRTVGDNPEQVEWNNKNRKITHRLVIKKG